MGIFDAIKAEIRHLGKIWSGRSGLADSAGANGGSNPTQV
jgi:hypothetical protein